MRKNHALIVVLIALAPCAAASAQVPTRLPQGPPGTVTLPVAEYDSLMDRAAARGTQPDPPPVPAVVARTELRGRVAGDMVRGSAVLEGEIFQRGHVKVALMSGAALLEARADGRALPLLHEGNTHAAILPGPSPFSATLEWAAPLNLSPGRASFVLPVSAGGSTSAIVDLPGDPADVRVDHGVITRREAAEGRTTLEITLESGRQASVSWSVRETAVGTAPAESRILADVKSLLTIGEAELRMVSLVDITVVRGELRTFEVRLPKGFEVAAVSGTSLETSNVAADAVALTVGDPSRRRHQFLISLEHAHSAGSFKVDTSFPAVPDAQREVGETAIEGMGTLDLTASGDAGLRRMDIRETNAALRHLARQPLLAAFRYQRRPGEARVLTLDVKRFADAAVLAAAAERASATTLVTVEGRMLTEINLWIRNRAQPFMKVTLPAGATMLSAEVAGETAKPVMGTDGIRVPLMRTGFRPDGPYIVSFVYLHAGQALAKRGDAQMALPKMDVPVSILEWELFLPERYSAKASGGNVIPAELCQNKFATVRASSVTVGSGVGAGSGGGVGGGVYRPLIAGAGQIVGRVTASDGSVLPGATVTAIDKSGVVARTITDAEGAFVLNGVPGGHVTLRSELDGFRPAERAFTYDLHPRQVDLRLEISDVYEQVEVSAESPADREGRRVEGAAQQTPSQNVLNLQRRVAGVLPVRMDVPRTGTSHRFVRPLVLEEETTVSFRYKSR